MDTTIKIAAFAQVTLTFYAWAVLFYAVFKFAFRYSHLWTAVRIDGGLYVCMGMATAATVCLQNNDVYKYLSPYFVFYAQSLANILLAGAVALKTFRSRSFGDNADEEKRQRTGNTERFTKPPTP
jgi:hypothetical protein